MKMNYPIFYATNSNGGFTVNIDSQSIKKCSFNNIGQIIDNRGNMISLGTGTNSYRSGDIIFYNLKRDTSFILKNPDYNATNKYIPQLVNDSLVLIGSRIWKYSPDTLIPMLNKVPVQYTGSYDYLYKPLTINSDNIIYEKYLSNPGKEAIMDLQHI